MPKITTILRQPRPLPKIEFSSSTTRSQSLETQIHSSNHTLIENPPKKTFENKIASADHHPTTRLPKCNAQTRATHHSCPAPSPWMHTTAATISDHKIERATARAPALLPSHGGDDADFHVTTPPIRSSPSNRTRKLREEKKKKTHLPRHRAAFPSLCPPCTWKPIRTHQEQATESRGDEREREKFPKISGRFIFVNNIWPAPSEVVSPPPRRGLGRGAELPN